MMALPLLGAATGAAATGSALGAAMLGATGLQVAGQLSAARAAEAAGQANATMYRQQADLTRQQGGARQESQMRRAREILGQQRAAIGQAGIGWGGSAQDVLEQSATNAELDTLNIGYEAELQARGLMHKATLSEWEGKQRKRAGYMQAATTVLGSAANYFGGGIGVGG